MGLNPKGLAKTWFFPQLLIVDAEFMEHVQHILHRAFNPVLRHQAVMDTYVANVGVVGSSPITRSQHQLPQGSATA